MPYIEVVIIYYMTQNMRFELECSNCDTLFDVEEESQKELDERVEFLNDEEHEDERLCPCCENDTHYVDHNDVDSELQYPNWADRTGFYITVACAKCDAKVNVEFEMRSDGDFEVE